MASNPESSLLLTLEEISRLVAHCHDASETLSSIVKVIQQRSRTDVCSVYLLESNRETLVLSATVGLKPESVGQLRMGLQEGLTGLVAEQGSAVMVPDAFNHPRFKYFPEAAEDPFRSFLGVPLIERGVLQGVLVVQTIALRVFSDDEVRMLLTVASQLVPLVSEAQFLRQVELATDEPISMGTPVLAGPLVGTPLSPGVGVGAAYFVEPAFAESFETVDGSDQVERLKQALEGSRDELSRLATRISALLGEQHGVILQGQLMILQDRRIETELIEAVGEFGSAERALKHTLDKYVALFAKLNNKYFQERIYDIRDVFRRILWQLRPTHNTPDDLPERIVLVAREVSVMDLFSVEPERLAAVVADQGGRQSHAAILARSLNIPMVTEIRFAPGTLSAGQTLLVDGTTGNVLANPSPEQISSVQPRVIVADQADAVDEPQPSVGLRVEANLNLPCEIDAAVACGAAGVGLFRSEFLFLARRTLPTEEEQVRIYRQMIGRLEGRPVSIRTFDLRPDKLAHWSRFEAPEHNSLDWRLVLDSPPLQQLFRDQVRAILRAATSGSARILVPFVNSTEQLDFVTETLEECREKLQREGLEFQRDVALGIMIESPAAAEMMKNWAPQVDFFALGTNDLVSSALGLSRDDPTTQTQHDPLHPGVLRLIHAAVTAAHYAGRPITVCGEMAGDPAAACVLRAFQVDSISVAVQCLPRIRRILAGQLPELAETLAPQLTCLSSAAAVRELVEQVHGDFSA